MARFLLVLSPLPLLPTQTPLLLLLPTLSHVDLQRILTLLPMLIKPRMLLLPPPSPPTRGQLRLVVKPTALHPLTLLQTGAVNQLQLPLPNLPSPHFSPSSSISLFLVYRLPSPTPLRLTFPLTLPKNLRRNRSRKKSTSRPPTPLHRNLLTHKMLRNPCLTKPAFPPLLFPSR